jgi:hypothetical protein
MSRYHKPGGPAFVSSSTAAKAVKPSVFADSAEPCQPLPKPTAQERGVHPTHVHHGAIGNSSELPPGLSSLRSVSLRADAKAPCSSGLWSAPTLLLKRCPSAHCVISQSPPLKQSARRADDGIACDRLRHYCSMHSLVCPVSSPIDLHRTISDVGRHHTATNVCAPLAMCRFMSASLPRDAQKRTPMSRSSNESCQTEEWLRRNSVQDLSSSASAVQRALDAATTIPASSASPSYTGESITSPFSQTAEASSAFAAGESL